MSRYNNITAGADVTDIAENESGYNYFLFVWSLDQDDRWVIMREKIDGTEYRFAVSAVGTSATTGWTNRASLTYKRANEFKY